MIGVVDIEDIVDREGTLGYWFDRVIWGRGYAFEASEVVTEFAVRDLGWHECGAYGPSAPNYGGKARRVSI
jgi:ribosomal-protein-alanine N-acetyltransferase